MGCMAACRLFYEDKKGKRDVEGNSDCFDCVDAAGWCLVSNQRECFGCQLERLGCKAGFTDFRIMCYSKQEPLWGQTKREEVISMLRVKRPRGYGGRGGSGRGG